MNEALKQYAELEGITLDEAYQRAGQMIRFADDRTPRQKIESARDTALQRSTDFFYPDKAAAAAQVVEHLTRALAVMDGAEAKTSAAPDADASS